MQKLPQTHRKIQKSTSRQDDVTSGVDDGRFHKCSEKNQSSSNGTKTKPDFRETSNILVPLGGKFCKSKNTILTTHGKSNST